MSLSSFTSWGGSSCSRVGDSSPTSICVASGVYVHKKESRVGGRPGYNALTHSL